MEEIGWRFPPLSGGTRQGYTNNDIEVFKGQELIDNLAREICQNSLDARKEDSSDPVKVIFELQHVPTNNDVFEGYRECLKGCRAYWEDEMDAKLTRFVTDAETTLSKESIPVLVARDYYTKGLSGNHSRKLSSPWEALTGSDGMSVKADENSAGSYGIGKNAPFACSSLSTVFYNTCAENNESAFIGVARLATLLNKEGKPTQRVGKYQKNNDEKEEWTPIYPEDTNWFRDMFVRTEQGTDVIIVAFNQEKDWINKVKKAVLKNFFVAIREEKLVVELIDGSSHVVVDSDKMSQYMSDLSNDVEMGATSQLYKAFSSPDRKELLEILEPKDVEVFIKSDISFKRTIANFRATGMLVGTYYKKIFQHYAAVVVVRGQKLGELLKDTEPPRHNRWDYKLINESDRERRKLAKNSIGAIEEKVLRLLKDQYEVVTEETVDAVGVGEYIPDDEDGVSGTSMGDDILKVKIKIGKVKSNPKIQGTTIEDGYKEEGGTSEGDVHNHKVNPEPKPPRPRPPKPVDPDDFEAEQVLGIAQGRGCKTVVTPNVNAMRAFPISSSVGLYKIVLQTQEAYENLYVSCSVVGEDGKTEALDMDSFTYNGESIRITEGKAGPLSIVAGKPVIFYARFKTKEKMKLRVHLMEVIRG